MRAATIGLIGCCMVLGMVQSTTACIFCCHSHYAPPSTYYRRPAGNDAAPTAGDVSPGARGDAGKLAEESDATARELREVRLDNLHLRARDLLRPAPVNDEFQGARGIPPAPQSEDERKKQIKGLIDDLEKLMGQLKEELKKMSNN